MKFILKDQDTMSKDLALSAGELLEDIRKKSP